VTRSRVLSTIRDFGSCQHESVRLGAADAHVQPHLAQPFERGRRRHRSWLFQQTGSEPVRRAEVRVAATLDAEFEQPRRSGPPGGQQRPQVLLLPVLDQQFARPRPGAGLIRRVSIGGPVRVPVGAQADTEDDPAIPARNPRAPIDDIDPRAGPRVLEINAQENRCNRRNAASARARALLPLERVRAPAPAPVPAARRTRKGRVVPDPTGRSRSRT